LWESKAQHDGREDRPREATPDTPPSRSCASSVRATACSTCKDITEVVRHLGIAESTWNRWRAQYGGMKADEAKRLRQLETENARLKKLLAEAEVDKAMLKELAEGNF